MKSFHVICAKCGSMDVQFKQFVNREIEIEFWNDENYIALSCNNCGELTDVMEHNEYMEEVKNNKKWYLS